jgi:hypothetical protein
MLLGFILNLLDIHVPLPEECTDRRRFKYHGHDIEGGLAFKEDGSIDMVCFSPDAFEYNLAHASPEAAEAMLEWVSEQDGSGWRYGFKEGFMPCRDGRGVYERKEDGWYRRMLRRDPETKKNKVVLGKLPWRLDIEINTIIVEYFSDKAHLLKGRFQGDKGE